MTCHRRENVHNREALAAVLNLAKHAEVPVYFPASYRTQRVLKEDGHTLPSNVIMVDPIGYQELLTLMANSLGVLTDSGTIVEETCVLQVPSVQMRRATERPQVYDARSSVKFDPTEPNLYPPQTVFKKLASIRSKKWEHGLGDGKASERIVADLKRRTLTGDFRRHQREMYHIPTARSYQGDELGA
jgi:UDP-N-acetylglucosamine 2-epimerase